MYGVQCNYTSRNYGPRLDGGTIHVGFVHYVPKRGCRHSVSTNRARFSSPCYGAQGLYTKIRCRGFLNRF